MTVDRIHVLATPGLDAHASYVAVLRHRNRADLHFGEDDFADRAGLADRLGRDRAKDMAGDYGPQSHAPGMGARHEAQGTAPQQPDHQEPNRQATDGLDRSGDAVPEGAHAFAARRGITWRERVVAIVRRIERTIDRIAGRMKAMAQSVAQDPALAQALVPRGRELTGRQSGIGQMLQPEGNKSNLRFR